MANLYRIFNFTGSSITLPTSEIVPTMDYVEIEYPKLVFCCYDFDFLDLVKTGDLQVTYNTNPVVIPITPDSGTSLPYSPITNNSVSVSTTPYNATVTDGIILVDSTVGDIVINLPSAATVKGLIMYIKKIDNSSNYVIIYPFSPETIDGDVGAATKMQNDILKIQSDGSNWVVI